MTIELHNQLIDKKIFDNNNLWHDLALSLKSELIKHASIYRYLAGDVIFHEDDAIDFLYIIQTGKITTTTSNIDDNLVHLFSMITQDVFGEEGLFQDNVKARSYNATAKEDSILIAINIAYLKDLINKNTVLKQQFIQLEEDHLVKQVSDKLNTMLKLQIDFEQVEYKVEQYTRRQSFFMPGDQAKSAFVILSGKVEIKERDNNGDFAYKTLLLPGDMFGDLELLENMPYNNIASALEDSTILLLSKKSLIELQQNQEDAKEYIGKLKLMHYLPHLGYMAQYMGEFHHMPALCNLIQIKDQDSFITYQVINHEIFAVMKRILPEVIEKIKFSDGRNFRTLILHDSKLVGLINNGKWNNSDQYIKLIFNNTEISQQNIKDFIKNGYFNLSKYDYLSKKSATILCNCMSVTENIIDQSIKQGCNNLQSISQLTGAGTVCGSCVPEIQFKLGINDWGDYILEEIIDLNKEVKSFRFRPERCQIPKYEPGQYVVIEALIDNVKVRRSYTITSIPEDSYIEITVKKKEGGYFSSWLFDKAAVNSFFKIAKPRGKFHLDISKMKQIICFVGGIGVTPSLAFWRLLSTKQNHQNILYIDYSVSYEDQFINKNLFKSNNKNLIINFRSTRSNNGHISQDEIKKITQKFPDSNAFICGPEIYQSFITNTLKEINFDQKKIYLEIFN